MDNPILLVGDQTSFAARFTAALKSAGVQAEIVFAADAGEAARWLETKRRVPAMVLVPPVIDVLALLRTLRAEERTRGIPVFVVRALPIAEDR